MTRYHATPEGNVPFTAEEEAARDAEEAAWDAGADDRTAKEVRRKRDAILKSSDWMDLYLSKNHCADSRGSPPAIWQICSLCTASNVQRPIPINSLPWPF